MRPGSLRTLIALAGLLSLSVMAFSASNDAAVLRSSGTAIVNGAAAPSTTALFKGDKVQTTGGAVVTISSPGSTVLVPSNSQMVFNGGVLNLSAGGASISTSKGMAAQTGDYRVAPATGGTAKFEIKKSGTSVLVHSTSGVLNVSAAGNTFTLAEGATVTLDPGTGASKHAAPGVYGAQSSTSFLSVGGVLSDPNDGVPFCTHVQLCFRPPSVSGVRPCRCKQGL